MPVCILGSVATYLSNGAFSSSGMSVVSPDSTWRARSILGTHSVVRCSENVFCCVK